MTASQTSVKNQQLPTIFAKASVLSNNFPHRKRKKIVLSVTAADDCSLTNLAIGQPGRSNGSAAWSGITFLLPLLLPPWNGYQNQRWPQPVDAVTPIHSSPTTFRSPWYVNFIALLIISTILRASNAAITYCANENFPHRRCRYLLVTASTPPNVDYVENDPRGNASSVAHG